MVRAMIGSTPDEAWRPGIELPQCRRVRGAHPALPCPNNRHLTGDSQLTRLARRVSRKADAPESGCDRATKPTRENGG